MAYNQSDSIWDYIIGGAVEGATKGLFGDPEQQARDEKRQADMYSSYKTFREMGMTREESEGAINKIYGGKKSGLMNQMFSPSKKVFEAPRVDSGMQKEIWDYNGSGDLVKVGSVPKGATVVSRRSSKDPNQWNNQDLLRYKDQLKKDMEDLKASDPLYIQKKSTVDKIDQILGKGFAPDASTGGSPAPSPDPFAVPSFQNNAAGNPGMGISPTAGAAMGQGGFGKAPSALAASDPNFVTLKAPNGEVATVRRSAAKKYIDQGAVIVA